MFKEFTKFFQIDAQVSEMEVDSLLDILISCSQPKDII